jgi:hypothetical protein
MEPEKGIDFRIGGTIYDFCIDCLNVIDRTRCKNCEGTGKVREVDIEASNAQATCGENRTQYRTVACQECTEIW